jgi:hypothetical protein
LARAVDSIKLEHDFRAALAALTRRLSRKTV